jgi:hypothetical protein
MGLDDADVQELQTIVEMIDGTKVKTRLLLSRINNGKNVKKEEIEGVEENIKVYLSKIMRLLQKEEQAKSK